MAISGTMRPPEETDGYKRPQTIPYFSRPPFPLSPCASLVGYSASFLTPTRQKTIALASVPYTSCSPKYASVSPQQSSPEVISGHRLVPMITIMEDRGDSQAA